MGYTGVATFNGVPGDLRVAPEANLPRIEIAWTESELASLAELVSSADTADPTEALVRAVRD